MLQTVQKIKGYKTVLFNVLVANAAVLFGQDVVNALLQLGLTFDDALEIIVAIVAAVNILLRAITDSPIFKKTAPVIEAPPSA